MSDKTGIEWTSATWPIVQGCTPLDQGCAHCYVPPVLYRMAHNPNPKVSAHLHGLAERYTPASGKTITRFTGIVALRHDRLGWPAMWKKPRYIFVPSHGDLFHKDVPDEFIDKVFAEMWRCSWHEFQVLTRRISRMRQYLSASDRAERIAAAVTGVGRIGVHVTLPLENVWCGTSVPDQPTFDERTPELRATPAAIRFLSIEPLLGRVDATTAMGWLDWAIVGGESGSKARPMHPDWPRLIRDQCESAGVPFFFKQWGEFAPEGHPDAGSWLIAPDGTAEQRPNPTWVHATPRPGHAWVYRVGKKAAGRLLEGRLHDEMPRRLRAA